MRRCLLLITLLSLPALATWTPVGAMPAPRRLPNGLEYRNAEGGVQILVVADGVVRVRYAPGPAFGRDHSYAVLQQSATPQFSVHEAESGDRLELAGLTVVIQRAPFRVRVLDAQGRLLDADTAADGMGFDGARVHVWKELRDEDHFYGFGEKVGPLDKRGNKLGGFTYTMWNSDVFGYDSSVDPLYDDIPFFMVLRDGITHGVFFDNTFRSSFDLGKESRRFYDFGAEGGELNYYLIAGPQPRQVLERFSALTGRIAMPPLWSLGYHQCRYSYYPESMVRSIAANFRSRHIPADTLWFDIHYMDGYRVFTWNHQRFPDPKKLLSDLNAEGFSTVAIVDPGVKVDPGYAVYQSGLAADAYAKLPDGKPFVGPVWPGPAAFPDFTRSATRQWWQGEIADFAKVGLTGIWNDMNEPSVFNVATGTMPDDVRFDNEGQASTHAEDHNVYGQQMSRATRDGLLQLRPDERPFVLTRATYAGGQRYAAVWTGDNTADWSHLRDGITGLLGMGISGFPFVGNDIGGFAGIGSADLWTRWAQAGAFFPFMRAHAVLGAPAKEPWAYGPVHEAYNRRAIERRYEFLPYIYNAFHQTATTGMPMMRALVLEYPDDPATYNLSDEYLFGDDLLVAPIISPTTTERQVYLPAGQWINLSNGSTQAGGQTVTVHADEDALPLFARAGGVLFRAPVMQNTRAWATAALTYEVFPGPAPSTRTYYEDDGHSFAYQHGDFRERSITVTPQAAGVEVQIGAPRGAYHPAHAPSHLLLHLDHAPKQITVNGQVGEVSYQPAMHSAEITLGRGAQDVVLSW